MLAGCLSRQGVAEFQLYANAFADVVKAAEPILAETRKADRTFELARIARGEEVQGVAARAVGPSGAPEDFRAAHAEIIAESGDPPYTASLRSSLAVLSSYNATLLKYAEGAALQAVMVEADRLRTESMAAFVAIGGTKLAATGSAAVAIAGLREVAELVARAGSREAFRQELVAREPAMQRLLDVLIESTEVTYEVITRENLLKARRATGDDRKAEVAKIEAKRKMMAEWVVVMRKSKLLLSRSIEASRQAPDLLATIAVSADIAGEIRLSAQRIRNLAAEAN